MDQIYLKAADSYVCDACGKAIDRYEATVTPSSILCSGCYLEDVAECYSHRGRHECDPKSKCYSACLLSCW